MYHLYYYLLLSLDINDRIYRHLDSEMSITSFKEIVIDFFLFCYQCTVTNVCHSKVMSKFIKLTGLFSYHQTEILK